MTVETALVSALQTASTSAGTRIYAEVLPQDAEAAGLLPAIVYSVVSTQFNKNAYGQYIGLQRPRFQLSCWARTYSGAVTLANQVIVRLNNYQGDGIQMSTVESAIDLRDIQAELYRRIVDVFVWHEDD